MYRSFAGLLSAAKAGEYDAIEAIFNMYMPLINHYSVVNGRIDEDCRQCIMIRIAMKISTFVI